MCCLLPVTLHPALVPSLGGTYLPFTLGCAHVAFNPAAWPDHPGSSRSSPFTKWKGQHFSVSGLERLPGKAGFVLNLENGLNFSEYRLRGLSSHMFGIQKYRKSGNQRVSQRLDQRLAYVIGVENLTVSPEIGKVDQSRDDRSPGNQSP